MGAPSEVNFEEMATKMPEENTETTDNKEKNEKEQDE